MSETEKCYITKTKQSQYMDALAKELVPFRAKIGLSQSELANLVGISRQTYSSIESGKRKMSWNTYLSLLLLFDYHATTHRLLRTLNLMPVEFFTAINNGNKLAGNSSNTIAGIPETITEKLDDKALHTIRTVVMIEYARCADISGDEVVKAFEGTSVRKTISDTEFQTLAAIQRIKEGNAKS